MRSAHWLALTMLWWLLATADAVAGPLPALKRPEGTRALLSLLNNTSVDALSGAFRGYLAHNLSPNLYEASPNWGHQKLVARGVKWTDQGHPEIERSLKNDGTWRKVRVTADNLADTLIFDIRNVQNPEPGRLTFDVFISFDAHVEYEHESWRTGTRLYSGSARARMRIKLGLKCEATAYLENNGALLPDTLVRVRVLQADLRYDNFVMEHIAGVGGEAARVLGDALKGGLTRWFPSLEQELLAKANAAIVKAGDTKEVRLTLSKLLGGKGH